MTDSAGSPNSRPRSARSDSGHDDFEAAERGDRYRSATPTSPAMSRRPMQSRPSDLDLTGHAPSERSGLLDSHYGPLRSYASMPGTVPGTPRPYPLRQQSGKPTGNARLRQSRAGSISRSFPQRLVNALGAERRAANEDLGASRMSFPHDDRVWYDQFTSTDWVHDSMADAYRVRTLRSRKDVRGRLQAWFDGAQGWILVAIIGCLTACVAYLVNVTESTLFDYKQGYCASDWRRSQRSCCKGATICDDWVHWSTVIRTDKLDDEDTQFVAFVFFVVAFSMLSCLLTLTTKTVIPSTVPLSTLDENLGADAVKDSDDEGNKASLSPAERYDHSQHRPPMVYYSAAGSGVAEVKVILSGFVLHGYLGVRTLVVKTLGLILSVASGLSLGKEGPYVHIATCIGNIACRLFSKYNRNDAKRREVLSASSAGGVGVAFGAPIGGVLFSLEEVSYYFPPKTLFRTFFCCIVAALSLKFLNPYGTNKIVLFEVRYLTDWKFFEMIVFVLVGVLGGALGALFIKASRVWARTFRRIPVIKRHPLLEVFLVALVTGLTSFWNRYTKLPVAELLFELASPCDTFADAGNGLCPTRDHIGGVLRILVQAFLIKAVLTVITFGIKVPAGIYVPSMVVGGLLGRIVGHVVQLFALKYADSGLFGGCDPHGPPGTCVVPGVYAMVAAGATMTGVTRLSVTLAVILFELTGSLDHVLPFSIAILVSKWTADALEPLSIYDLLTDMNSYPFLDNKVRPLFTGELGDITPRVRAERVIDISDAPLVPARALRRKQETLHLAGELDGGVPILRHGVLVGLIPVPDLEFALDKLDNEDNSLCLMSTQVQWNAHGEEDAGDAAAAAHDPTDFTPYIDCAPVSLDCSSPMDLAYECFVKLGLRYICVLRDGKFAGLVHKKAFVKYVKELERHEH